MLLTDHDPDKAEYDDQGRLIGRPMLVPAVGAKSGAVDLPTGQASGQTRAEDDERDWFEDDDGDLIPGFTPVKRKRMGVFTPVAAAPSEAPADEAIADERGQDVDKSVYADDMRGEEMEQHISEVTQAAAGTGGGSRTRINSKAQPDGWNGVRRRWNALPGR